MNKTQWQGLKNKGKVCFNIIFAVVFVCMHNANAQMFGDDMSDVSSAQEQNVEQEATKAENNSVVGQRESSSENMQRAVNNRAPSRKTVQPRNTVQNRNVTQNRNAVQNRNSTSESDNTNVSVRKIENKNDQEKEAKIYLYYRDYKVSRGINGRVSCSMRFYVYSTAPEKITNISYRLKWPGIETPVSFDNVAPNTPAYYDYALLGEGCYNMDTPPNIIVNRCRIKGYSQKYCSSIIQWTK